MEFRNLLVNEARVNFYGVQNEENCRAYFPLWHQPQREPAEPASCTESQSLQQQSEYYYSDISTPQLSSYRPYSPEPLQTSTIDYRTDISSNCSSEMSLDLASVEDNNSLGWANSEDEHYYQLPSPGNPWDFDFSNELQLDQEMDIIYSNADQLLLEQEIQSFPNNFSTEPQDEPLDLTVQRRPPSPVVFASYEPSVQPIEPGYRPPTPIPMVDNIDDVLKQRRGMSISPYDFTDGYFAPPEDNLLNYY
uniref:Uncharacterized protein n=1 Tax=Bracon brevicornis TaxID=1563983 RepID=A0A6V7LKC8_9HYME